MKVTLKEIAAKANVSVGTVSAALRGPLPQHRSDAVARASRIRRIADELDYRPNVAARSLIRRRFHAVTLILPHSSDFFVPEQVAAMSRTLAKDHYQLSIAHLNHSAIENDPEFLPQVLRERSCDGFLVIWHGNLPQTAFDAVHRHRTPTIWVNGKVPTDGVYPDEQAAAIRLVEKVRQCGHRSIGWLRWSKTVPGETHFSMLDREHGLCEGAARHGLRSFVNHPGEEFAAAANGGHPRARSELLVSQWKALLRKRNRPSCIVGLQEADTFAALRAASELNLLVPRDLSVVAFANPGVEAGSRGLSIMRIPQTVIGERAARELLRKIEQPEAERPTVVLPHEWVPGHTLAPPLGRSREASG